MKAPLVFGLLSLSLWATQSPATDVGESLPAYSLSDDSGQEHTLDDSVRRIYATIDRKGDKLLDAALQEGAAEQLGAQQAIVIADISDAPGFVKRIIRGSLEDRPYRTWMDTRGSTRKTLPTRKGGVSLVELERMQIRAIRSLNSVEEIQSALQEALSPLPAAPTEPPPEPSTDASPAPEAP